MVQLNQNMFSANDLPSYRNPPIYEVVRGIRFDKPDKLRIPHIGLLWDKFRSDYPIIQHAPPIVSGQDVQMDIQSGIPLPRVWLINESDDQLVQFQFDRFYFNWRRRKEAYPRYSYVIKRFESVLDTTVNFFNEFEIGELRPIECELSYINHIPQGQGWNTIDDLPKIFSDFVWNQKPGRFLPNPEKVNWHAKYKLQEGWVYLIVNLRQAIQSVDKVPLFVFELTARGLGESTDKNGVREWFDAAHECIIRGFTDLTTYEVQKIWERV